MSDLVTIGMEEDQSDLSDVILILQMLALFVTCTPPIMLL